VGLLSRLKALFGQSPAPQVAIGIQVLSSSTSPRARQVSSLPEIGTTQSVCPYCGTVLAKKPQRKTKCKDCGNYIYVRTRPSDNQPVSLTEEQVDQIEEQWSIVNGVHEEWLAERKDYEDTKARLTVKYGREPGKNDIRWNQLSNASLRHAQQRDWGLYRNDRLEMAELLRKEDKHENALAAYLEVCYLDANGPRNVSGYPASPDYPPFSSDQAFLAPGVIAQVDVMADKLGYGLAQITEAFMYTATIYHHSLRLPVTPDEAWEKLRPKIIGKGPEE
jgi:hypothetical protein